MTEEEQFRILIERNPHPGIPFKSSDYIDNVVSKKGSKFFNIFGWAIGSEKKVYKPKSRVVSFLSKYGISFQVYYDVVVLGLTSINQRPKCPICGKDCKFSYRLKTYLNYCGDSCKGKSRFDVVDRTIGKSDKEMFLNVLSKNPQIGIPFRKEEYLRVNGNNKFINIFSWISGLKDNFVEISKLERWLKKYGLTTQIYYDIVVLGLTSMDQRPKCVECDNVARFSGITAGYLKTCSSECYNEMNRNHIRQLGVNSKGRKMSDSTKQKIRDLKTGLKYSEESSFKKSIKMAEWILNNGGMSSRKYKRGEYTSTIFNNTYHYDSSWEKYFIQLLEKSCIKNDIISLERCKETVDYLKDDESRHKYIPDFDIKLKNGYRVIVEIKPKNLLEKDRIVFLKKEAGYKHFKKQKQTLYIILTENELFKNNFWLYDYLVIV